MKHLKYISRIDTDRTHGYQVRMPLIKKGVPVMRTKEEKNKFFSDTLYDDSFAAALAYRNHYLTKKNCKRLLEIKASLGTTYTESHRNTSGVIGVHLSETIKKSGTYYGFKAQYQIKGVQHRKEYSCTTYGYEGAFILACRMRYKNSGTLIILDESLLPCLPDRPYKIKDAI